jgi:hypothetical protein
MPTMRLPRPVVLGALLSLASLAAAAPGEALAQGLEGGALIQTYTFENPQTAGLETFRLISVPYAASVALGSRVSLAVDGAWASGEATSPSGLSAELSGPTDTQVGATFTLGPDWLVLSADATFATGKSTLSLAESLVAGIVAADLLPFAINTWGSAGSVGGSAAAATQLGAWGVGFAAGYWVAGEFEPLSDVSLGYSPGNHLQLRVAVDRDLGASTLSGTVGYQRFSDDEIVGANLFKSGSRIQSTVSLAFPLGLRSSALVYGGVNHRSQGTLLLDQSVLGAAGDSPSQQLFLAGTDLRIPLGRASALLPSAELRVFRAEDGASQGWLASAGTSLDLRLAGNSASRRIVLSPSARVRTGNVIVEEGADSGIFGWELGLIVRLEPGR